MTDSDFDLMNVRVTFKNIPLHALSRFAFKDVGAAVEAFKQIPDVDECVIVQTASRVEVFTVSHTAGHDTPDARREEGKTLVFSKLKETWISLAEMEQNDIDHLDQILEVYKGPDVYRHLLRLACGLDSVVVGKQEIFNEIVASITSAKQAEHSGRVLNKLFDNVIRVSKRVRESTDISKNVISLGDIAVKIAAEKTGLDAKKKVLLIGTGAPAAMIAKTLNKNKLPFEVTSRTIDRATGFSQILGGTPVSFEDAMFKFDKFDIVFVATTSDYFLITFERIHMMMEEKKKGTLILDLSDPRTVDEGITALPGIKLLFRDQVSEIYEESVMARAGIVPYVEKIIEKEIPLLEATMHRIVH